jgi:hypothetical protein
MIRQSGEHKEVIRKSIQVSKYLRIQRLRGGCIYDIPLGAPADGSCDVYGGCRAAASWQDKARELWEALGEPIDFVFECLHHASRGSRHRSTRVVGSSQIGPEHKQFVLYPIEGCVYLGECLCVLVACSREPENRIQLVDRSIGADARVDLFDPVTTKQASLTAITGLRIYFHGYSEILRRRGEDT